MTGLDHADGSTAAYNLVEHDDDADADEAVEWLDFGLIGPDTNNMPKQRLNSLDARNSTFCKSQSVVILRCHSHTALGE
jgi:hypothetical protein